MLISEGYQLLQVNVKGTDIAFRGEIMINKINNIKKYFGVSLICCIIIFTILTGCSKSNGSEKIKYQILFKGFAALNEFNQPLGVAECIVFTSEDDWMDYCDENFESFPSVITEINDRAINFQSESLILVYSLGPRHAYDSFVDIKYLLKNGNDIKVEFEDKKDVQNTIYVLSNETSENSLTKHAAVFLLSVKPSDISSINKTGDN